MPNTEQPRVEKKEAKPRIAAKERYDNKTGFPYVITYNNLAYDLRELSQANGNGLYRMTSEARISLPEPSYIEVDKEGYIVKEWN